MRRGYILFSLLLACALEPASAGWFREAFAAVSLNALAIAGVAALGFSVGVALAGRSRPRYRHRRDASLEELDEEEASSLWDMVSTNDQAGCVRKLICLLEAAEGRVDQDEQLILAFLGPLKDLAKTQRASKVPYETAGWLGRLRGAKSCEVAFGTSCPYTRENMMAIIKTIWRGALNDDQV